MVYGSGVDLDTVKNNESSINVVRINVGGVRYETLLSTLQSEESMLSSMFSGHHKVERDKDGCIFIDRPGENFGCILNYLRDNSLIPSNNLTIMQIYTEACYYQIESLIKHLESKPEVFRSRLRKAASEKYENFTLMKKQLITEAQRRSEVELTSQAKVYFLTSSDLNKLNNPPECVFNDHLMSVFTGESNHKETFDQLKQRLSMTNIVVSDNAPDFDMEKFVNKIEQDLKNDGYNCTIWDERFKCSYKNNYTGKECNFSLREYVAEFKWE